MRKVLVAACVYNTPTNDKLSVIKAWFDSLIHQQDFYRHNNNIKVRLFIYDNSPTSIIDELKEFYTYTAISAMPHDITFLGGNGVNLGTAGGINECWKHAEEGEYLVKMDDDVVVNETHWLRQMVEVMERTPKLGILALKRKDLSENPNHENVDFRSELMMVPQEKGQRWYIIEKIKNVFGTIQMYSPELFKRIGYMEQIGPYGFDDYIMSVKCYASGMIGAFLPHIEIEHLDEGGNEYTEWKIKQAGQVQQQVIERAKEYKLGLRELYYDGGFKELSS